MSDKYEVQCPNCCRTVSPIIRHGHELKEDFGDVYYAYENEAQQCPFCDYWIIRPQYVEEDPYYWLYQNNNR